MQVLNNDDDAINNLQFKSQSRTIVDCNMIGLSSFDREDLPQLQCLITHVK